MEEIREPMRGIREARSEAILFVHRDAFYKIGEVLKSYEMEGISGPACEEIFDNMEQAITYEAVKAIDQVISETMQIVEASIRITRDEGRKVVTLWDVRRAIRSLYLCPFPWCKKEG